MKKPAVSLIAALGKNRALGKNNQLLWKLPKDMKRFREITRGHPVIMGRKTWESLPENYRPLPDRTNLIVTRQINYKATKTIICNELIDAIEIAKQINQEEIFIIGGAQIYEQALAIADRVYLTIVDDAPEADTFFPKYQDFFANVQHQEKGVDNGFEYTFQILEK